MERGPIEFGVFHEFPRSEGMTDTKGFDHGFELVDAAEKWGLDVMWLAELHISPRSVLACRCPCASRCGTPHATAPRPPPLSPP